MVSAAATFYCASKSNGDYEYIGLDWTGEIKQTAVS
jgi:hypothetical protein